MRVLGAGWRALPTAVRDGVLALVLTVVGQAELLALGDAVSGSRPLQHLAFAVLTGALVLRRVRPVPAALVVSAALAVQTLLGEAPAVAGFAAVLVATYSVAQYADRRRDAVAGLLAVLASVQVYGFVAGEVDLATEVGNLGIVVLVWSFARLARERLDRAVRAEREALAARERVRDEERARAAAVAAERRRIAREMHDVVGHGVTLMLLHTDAVQARLAGREPGTAAALDVVLAAGRSALEDLHRMLRVLREGADDPAADGPGTVADVEDLVAAAAAGGRDVALAIEGRVRPLPAALEATVHRIVQEGLTNALRHAPGGRVRVRLGYGERDVEVEVVDNGGNGGPTGRGGPGAGFGLAGIRERVALFDGRVSAGPAEGGAGWCTRAELPVPAPEPAPA